MELSEEELECIKFFPTKKSQLPLALFEYFETRFLHIYGITGSQLYENVREDIHSHNPLLNDGFKTFGKDFLVIDSERYLKFSVRFMDDIGFEIYVNKDNTADNRLHFLNEFYHDKIMISDSQTEKLLNSEKHNEIKNQLLVYMNLYKRFEIFWNSVACYLAKAQEEYGFRGHFLNSAEGNYYSAKKRNGLIYLYGKIVTKDDNCFYKKQNVLVPFENFVPVLDGIVEDMKTKAKKGK